MSLELLFEKGASDFAVRNGENEIHISGDSVCSFIPIEKMEEESRMVYGYASTEAIDKQSEIVSRQAIEEALPEYLKWRNIREMHGKRAVGVAPEIELRDKGLWIGAKIVDDSAWKMCKEGVYKGFSIGGRRLGSTFRFCKDIGKSVPVVTKMLLTEISLVDHPANPECSFALAKINTTTNKKDKNMNVLRKTLDLLKSITGQIEQEVTNDELVEAVGEANAEKAADLIESLTDNQKASLAKMLTKSEESEVVEEPKTEEPKTEEPVVEETASEEDAEKAAKTDKAPANVDEGDVAKLREELKKTMMSMSPEDMKMVIDNLPADQKSIATEIMNEIMSGKGKKTEKVVAAENPDAAKAPAKGKKMDDKEAEAAEEEAEPATEEETEAPAAEATEETAEPVAEEETEKKGKKTAKMNDNEDLSKEITDLRTELENRKNEIEELKKSLQETNDLFKTLSEDNGLAKAMTSGVEVMEKAEGLIAKYAELETEFKTIKDDVELIKSLRGIRRSVNPEGSTNFSWADELAPTNAL